MAVTAEEVRELKALAPNESLFLNSKSQPMEYYIPPHKSDIPAKCAQLVQRFGGVVQKKWTPSAVVLFDPDARPDMSSIPKDIPTYSIAFVKDSIIAGRALKLAAYHIKLNPSASPRGGASGVDINAAIDAHMKKPWQSEGAAFRALDEELKKAGVTGHTAASLREIYRSRKPAPAAAGVGSKRALRVSDAEEDMVERPSQRAARVQQAEQDEEERPQDDLSIAAATAGDEEVQKARDWVSKLANEARVSRNVVLHALYVHSGSVRRAREFLLRQQVAAELRWSAHDDAEILNGGQAAVDALIDKRGSAAVNNRLAWLEGREVAL